MENVANTTGKNDPAVPEFILKDSVTVQGITEDFIWYEADILMRDMGAWGSRFKRLVETMEARHKEHLHMIDGLLHENKLLKEQLKNDRT
jgi:hypothetical protein